MNLILELVRHPAASRWGEVLLHFLWQGTAVAALLAVVLARLRHATAATRYQLACAALGLMAVLPLATWLVLDGSDGLPLTASLGGSMTTVALPSGAASGLGGGVSNLPWRGAVMLLWILGAAGFGVRLIGGWWQARRLTERNVVPLGAPWTGRLRELAHRLEVSRPVRLLESAAISAPLVLGWLRPVILMPVGLVTNLSPGEVGAILAHELAHLRRHDYLVNLAQRVTEALLFYHPAVWWVSERIRTERENCCDDLAALAVGDGRVVARALVALAERNVGIPALALAADGGALGERVRRLLGAESAGGRIGVGRRLLWIAGFVLLMLGGVWAFSQAMAPKLFVAVARLRLEAPSVAGEPGKSGSYDPYFIQTEFEVIRSQTVLREVAERFGLAKSAEAGSPLTPEQATAWLRERLRVTQYHNTSLVEVQVAAGNALLAAELANGVVDVYLARSRARRSEKGIRERDIMERAAQDRRNEAEEVMAGRLQIEEKLAQLAPSDPTRRQLSERVDSMRRDYEARRASYESLAERIRELGLSLQTTGGAGEVIDAAVPPLRARRWRLVRD
jgi:Zn-dependent protease with chaperone function